MAEYKRSEKAMHRIYRVIDSDGYRENVGIILCNSQAQVMLAHRIGKDDGWQFPQGGVSRGETLDHTLYRELWEETGLEKNDVKLLAATNSWLRYQLPKHMLPKSSLSPCIGQKQMWFLLELTGSEESIRFNATDKPEFDSWKWIDYWHSSKAVVYFKRRVYECALAQLEAYLPNMAQLL